jgi:hypothetical protein
MEPKKIGILSN